MTLPKFKDDDDQTNINAVDKLPSNQDSFDEPVRRVPKLVKWLAGTAVGLVILAAAGGYVATQLIDQQKYKALVVSKVEDATGYTVDWDGNINLGMMPLPHATVNKLTVKANDRLILSVAKADVQVALAPLLSKKVEIKNITIDEPVVTLTTTQDRTQTWITKPKTTSSENAISNTNDTSSSSATPDIVVNSIEINGGSLVVDNQQSKSRQELKNLNLRVLADSLKGPFDISGNTEWSGQSIELKATSGEVNISEGSYPIQTKVTIPQSGIGLSFSGVVDTQTMGAKGDITLDVDDIAKAAKGMTGSAPSLPEGIDGKAALAGKLVYSSSRVAIDDMALSMGALAYTGQISADGLDGNEPPQISFQLQPTAKASQSAPQLVQLLSDLTIAAKGSLENDKVQIVTANIKSKGNDISINGFSTLGANPNVDMTVTAPEINLDYLNGQSESGAVVDKKANTPATKEAKGFSVPFSGRVRANIDKLVTGGKTYSNIKADIMSQSGALTISNADIALPQNTTVNVNGRIGNTSDLSGLNLKLSAKTQDTEKLMDSLGVKPLSLPQKIGAASMNGQFTGDLKNLGFTATVSALQFNVKGEGMVGDPLGAPAINSVKFNIQHLNFNEALKIIQPGFAGSSGFYGAMDLSGQLAWGDNKVDVLGLTGKLGQTTVAGNISAITSPKTKLSADLNFGNIVFPSANNNGGTVNATSRASAPKSSGGERWSRETIDTPWMQSFDANLTVKAKSITQNLWKLSDANLAFKLNDGVLTLDDVSAGLFGGRASINGTIKSGAGVKDPLTISTQLKANNVDAQGLMSAAMGKVSHVLSGTLSNVDVTVRATGSSPATLIQTLGGEGSVNGKNIVVTGVDVVALSNAAGGSFKPLERVGALSKSMGGDNQTQFDTFDSQFSIDSGVLNLKKCVFDSADASMGTTGTVNLPQWSLNLNNKLVLKSNEAEPITFSISGSLDNPAQSGLQNYLMNRATKLLLKDNTKLGKTLGKLLGGGIGGGAVSEPAPATVEPAPTTPTDSVAPTPDALAPQKVDPKEEAAKEAVKALQGLFGK